MKSQNRRSPESAKKRGRVAKPPPGTRFRLYATASLGTESVLATEIADLGATDPHAERGGVAFEGTLETAYRVCLWSRVASRLFLPLATFRADSPKDLYEGIRSIDWTDHLGPRATLAVSCSTSRSKIDHSHFASLKAKDAIVDQLRDRTGARPSIDVKRPDLRVNVRIHLNRAIVSIDLAGEAMHRRGYRSERGLAPLKENLAAAVLRLADWPRLAAEGAPLVDPMCGSGTLPIEAACIATKIAPGLARQHHGFLGWRAHDRALWRRLVEEAGDLRSRDGHRHVRVRGFDANGRMVRAAIANVERAGLTGIVHIEKRAVSECAAEGDRPGLVVVNPPYGERLGAEDSLAPLYSELGDMLRRRFTGWTGYVLAGNPKLARKIGLRPSLRHPMHNGPIECRLLEFPISEEKPAKNAPGWRKSTEDSRP